ncbi:MAG TPA: threonine--tRNA ligase, partial [Rhodobacteraceae bacterium]|nr:threonine--tRNA ligase [Paracoccaceae bacterium]
MAQISLTLPDNSIRKYEVGVTAADVATDIASSLAKKAISATVGGEHFDLAWPIEVDSTIAIHTMKDELKADELIRHDL